MKAVRISFLFAAVFLLQSMLCSVASAAHFQKIAIHQVNPLHKSYGVTCRSNAARCHFTLPIQSRTGVGAVDVNVRMRNDEACVSFKFGDTALEPENEPELCLKSREKQTVTLYFPGKIESRHGGYNDLAGRVHYHRVADIQVSVNQVQAAPRQIELRGK